MVFDRLLKVIRGVLERATSSTSVMRFPSEARWCWLASAAFYTGYYPQCAQLQEVVL